MKNTQQLKQNFGNQKANTQKSNTAALIHAGGRGMRMGGMDKALIERDNSPLIFAIAASLGKLCDKIYISRQEDQVDLSQYGQIVVDFEKDQGPLCGLVSGLRVAKNDGYRFLITAAVDTEFFPNDVYSYLFAKRCPHAVLKTSDSLHPTFALIDLADCDEIENMYFSGERRLASWINPGSVGYAIMEDFELVNLNSLVKIT